MFVGRDKELATLLKLKEKNFSSLISITGRRRIGKSRLLEEFAKSFKKSFFFMGLSPEKGVGHIEQKREFSRLLSEYFSWPEFQENNWAKLFSLLAKQTQKGEVLIVFDEISWMAKDDKLFLSQLKNAWDKEFKGNNKLVLAVCGSVSSWIEKNILSSTGFVGRISESLHLKELPIETVSKFWGAYSNNISPREKIQIISVTGGVPRYLEEVIPKDSAVENIRRLCFSESGFLFNEFERLFSDLFAEKQGDFRFILKTLGEKCFNQEDLSKKLQLSSGGTLSQRLKELESLGFIRRDYTWNITKGSISKLSRYRVMDNYTRFYLRYIEPNIHQILKSSFPNKGLEFLPSWSIIMGLQFENLVLSNRGRIYDLMDIDSRDVIQDGSFFQVQNKDQEGVQIDYLIQLRFNSLYLCELKSSSNIIGMEVVKEVEAKRKRLKVSKLFSIRPVLISSGPVSQSVYDSRYFYKIITGEDIIE